MGNAKFRTGGGEHPTLLGHGGVLALQLLVLVCWLCHSFCSLFCAAATLERFQRRVADAAGSMQYVDEFRSSMLCA